MRTKAFPVLSLFLLILLIPASSSSNLTQHSPTNHSSPHPNNPTSTQAPGSEDGSLIHTTQAGEKVSRQNDTSSATPSTKPSVTSLRFPKTSQFHLSTPATTQNTTSPTAVLSKTGLFLILLAILVLAVVVGCLHHMRNQQPGQESSVTRLVLGVRDRLRTGIGHLEDRMGVRLWPGAKTGEEEGMEVEDGRQTEDAGQQRDGEGEEGSSETSSEDKEEDKEEDSKTSDECSSMEGEDLRENVLNRREEEEENQSKTEDEEDTSSGSDEGQSAAEGDNVGDKTAGSEEIALINSPQEDEEKTDLCDVTVL